MEIIKAINGVFWGWLIAGILLSCGIFYTIRLGFPQVRYFTQLVPNLWKASRDSSGVSAFGALCSAIGEEHTTEQHSPPRNSVCGVGV